MDFEEEEDEPVIRKKRKESEKAKEDPLSRDTSRYKDMIINGIVACMVSFLFYFQFSNFVMAIFAQIVGINSKIYSNGVQFAPTRAMLNDSNQQVIFLSSPILCGFIAFAVYANSKLKMFSRGIGRSFCFWLTVHGYTYCFGAVITGIIFGTNVGFLSKHSKIPYYVHSIFAIIAAVLFVAVSVRLVVIMMRSVFTRHLLSLANRPMLIFYQIWIPFFSTTALVLLITVPKFYWFMIATWFSSLLGLLSIAYLARRSYIEVKIPSEKNYKMSVPAIVVLVLMVICIQVGLYHPIPFKF